MNKKYRKALIAGNWKMNMLPSEAKGFIDALKTELPKQKSCDVAICAPFVVMPALMKAAGGSRIGMGAQVCSKQTCHQKQKPLRMKWFLFLVETDGLEPSTSRV